MSEELLSTWQMIKELTDNPLLEAKLILDGDDTVHDNLTVRISRFGHIYPQDAHWNLYSLSIHHKWKIVEVANYHKEDEQ